MAIWFRGSNDRRAAGGVDPASLAARALAGSVVPTFILGHDGRVVLWNPACEALTGLTAAEVVGTSDHWKGFYKAARPCLADLAFGRSGDVGALYAANKDGAAAPGALSAENWCDLPCGKRRYLALDACPIRDAAGAIVAVVETLQDLTPLKEAQTQMEAAGAQRAAELEAVREAIGSGLDRLARGDLLARVEAQLPGAADVLRTDFNAAASELQAVLSTLAHAIGAIREGIGEISDATDDLSLRTGQQAASLETTAGTLDGVTGTVVQASADARHARKTVATAREDAEGGRAVVRDAMAAMTGIEASSDQIGQIIGVIDEIAFQTNLLALNAGVEAARAGDFGRGFAVVASEVRALAQRSADAAKEIKGLISTSQDQVRHGVALVGRTNEALDRIVGQVLEMDATMEAIAASAERQAVGLREVNHAMGAIGQVTQQNAAMSEQSTAAVRLLVDQTDALATQIARFEIGGGQAARPAAAKAHAAPRYARSA